MGSALVGLSFLFIVDVSALRNASRIDTVLGSAVAIVLMLAIVAVYIQWKRTIAALIRLDAQAEQLKTTAEQSTPTDDTKPSTH